MTEYHQMSIWDYMTPVVLDNLSEHEMVRQIENQTGLKFSLSDSNKWSEFVYYEAKDKGVRYQLHYDTYMNTTTRFIAVGWDYKTSGGGCPCDSVDEAVNKIRNYILYAAKEKERLRTWNK